MTSTPRPRQWGLPVSLILLGILGFIAAFALTLDKFALHVLCPWCMVTWAATVPLFLVVALHTARAGALPLPAPLRRFAGTAFGWIPFITLACYLVVAGLAQWQLDVLGQFIR